MERSVSTSLILPSASGTEPALHCLLDGLQPPRNEASVLEKELGTLQGTAPTTNFSSLYPAPHLAAGHLPHKQAPAGAGAEPGYAKRSFGPADSAAYLSNWEGEAAAGPASMQQQFLTPVTQGLGLASKQGPHQLPFTAELQHQHSFTIPAFKCLTEEDLILTDDLEYGGVLSAAFGELADPSKMGFLPSEEDLKLQLFDPTPPPAAPLAPAPHPSLVVPKPSFYDPLLPSLAAPSFVRSSPFGLQQQLQQLQLQAALRQQEQQQGQQQLQLELELELQHQAAEEAQEEPQVKQEHLGPAWGRLGDPDSHTPPSRSSSLASLKRRMDAIDLEDPGSARGTKRSSSFTSLMVWEATATATDAAADLQRVASAPQNLSRFSLGAGSAGAGRSLSPSPTPTPMRRAERASPTKTPVGHAPQRVQSSAAAFDLVSIGGNAQAVYKGVSKHKLTQRWEASLWLAGRQLYLGGFDAQEDAARAYDIAALACKGEGADTNFPASDYGEQMREVQGLTRDEVVAYVRRRSSAFSRGKSRFRGVSGHEGRWEARIGSFQGRKNVSFGIFETEGEAAKQYDRALILEKGRSAKTNFPIRDYEREVAEYEAFVVAKCGGFNAAEAADIAQDYTLPPYRTATLEDKKRSAVIYAEDLRQRLW